MWDKTKGKSMYACSFMTCLKLVESVNRTGQNCASQFPFHGLDNHEFISTVDDKTTYVKDEQCNRPQLIYEPFRSPSTVGLACEHSIN